jgi:hypothetical protein
MCPPNETLPDAIRRLGPLAGRPRKRSWTPSAWLWPTAGSRRPDAVKSLLTVEQILAWADAFHARTGRTPDCSVPSVGDRSAFPRNDHKCWPKLIR